MLQSINLVFHINKNFNQADCNTRTGNKPHHFKEIIKFEKPHIKICSYEKFPTFMLSK